MSASVFISYRRLHRPFAERLKLDLEHAGLTVWRDHTDIPLGSYFENDILKAIADSTYLVLLASPDAAESEWVRREVLEAQRLGKTVIPIRLAGKSGTLPAEWERMNLIEHAASDYWGTLRRLAKELRAPVQTLPSIADRLNGPQGTVAEALADFPGAVPLSTDDGREYAQLPLAPFGYCNSWLVAPLDARLRWPPDLAVLHNFTGDAPGTRHKQSLTHWAGQVEEPWMLMLEGPVNVQTRKYEMRTGVVQEWDDAISAGEKLIHSFAHGRERLGFYFNSLVPLTFEIGVRTTMLTRRRRVFHFNTHASPARYELAFDGWA